MRSMGRGLIVVAAVMAGVAWSPSGVLGGDLHHLREERIIRMEQALQQAAIKSPRWHSLQIRIQRDILDIAYFLEQAIKAADPADVESNAREAQSLLDRALNHGHFEASDVAPIVHELRRLRGAKL